MLVTSYFDDECEEPWDFVERSGDGRFDAVVTMLVDDDESYDGIEYEGLLVTAYTREHSLGVFDTVAEALGALRAEDARERARQNASVTGFSGLLGEFMLERALGLDRDG